MTIRKRGTRYHYDFMIRRQRYRGALPEALTKAEAQQAEAKIKNNTRGAIIVLSEYRQKRRHKIVSNEKRQAL